MNIGRAMSRHAGLVLLITDIVGLLGLLYLAETLRLGFFPAGDWIKALFLVGIVTTTLYIFNVYQLTSSKKASQLAIRTIYGVAISAAVVMVVVYAAGPRFYGTAFGRGILAITLSGFAVWAALWRYGLSRSSLLTGRRITWWFIGGAGSLGSFSRDFEHHGMTGNLVASIKPETTSPPGGADVAGFREVASGRADELAGAILESSALLTDQENRDLMTLRLSGVPVFSVEDFYEENWSKIPTVHLEDNWFVLSSGFGLVHDRVRQRIKRLADVAGALLLLPLALPVGLVAALLIKLDSAGPVLFRQVRKGLGGKQFTIVKFRTMVESAEREGARWAEQNDPRITRVGRILRRLRIDELPQLWNVIRGEMSFIGPRPERPEFTEELEKSIPYYSLRHMVKPGITGWAQVVYPYGASEDDAREKLEYDLYYIKNYSLLLDLIIVFKTIRVVLRGSGR